MSLCINASTNGRHHINASVEYTTMLLSVFTYYNLHCLTLSKTTKAKPSKLLTWPQPFWMMQSATLNRTSHWLVIGHLPQSHVWSYFPWLQACFPWQVSNLEFYAQSTITVIIIRASIFYGRHQKTSVMLSRRKWV